MSRFQFICITSMLMATVGCSPGSATSYKLETSTVIVYRLDFHVLTADDAQPSATKFHDWPILEKTIVTSPTLAEELSAAINNPDNYGGMAPSCFTPGMGVTFGSGERLVDVVICLKCNQLYFPDRDEYRTLSGRGVRELARLYVAVFPAEADKLYDE